MSCNAGVADYVYMYVCTYTSALHHVTKDNYPGDHIPEPSSQGSRKLGHGSGITSMQTALNVVGPGKRAPICRLDYKYGDEGR